MKVGIALNMLTQEGRPDAAVLGDHLATEFAFGGMPHHEAELNMRLFADRVMPALQRDAAFAAPVAPGAGEATPVGQSEGIFAPA